MRNLPDKLVDLTVTSPPYDSMREYNGFVWDFEATAKELFRITKDGGIVVWVIGDETVSGSETGSSFRQALYFKSIGFNLHDTMIWRKTKVMPRDPRIPRYWQGFEYMFVFSKGKPKTCNHIMVDAIHAGKTRTCGTRSPDGTIRMDRYEKTKGGTVKDKKVKDNVWEYATAQYKGHPAPFPEQLANDHIISWSNPGDIVFDPFLGSGTTAKMAVANGRNFLGFDLSEEYCKLAKNRVNLYIIDHNLQETYTHIA